MLRRFEGTMRTRVEVVVGDDEELLDQGMDAEEPELA